MAAELKIAVEANYRKSGVSKEISESCSVDITGTEILDCVQSVGTSEEALELGQDIGTPGYLVLKNLDPTNYVSLRRATGEGNTIKIPPLGLAVFHLEATAPFLIANTAACRVRIRLFEV